MNLWVLFGVLAALIQIYGYWLYNKAIYTGKIKPNPASWFLWSLGNIIASWSYLELVHDVSRGLLPLVCAIISVGTFFFALFKGKFEKPDRESVLISIVDLQVIGFWLLTESETWTNLLMQIDAMVSFLPIIRDTWKHPEYEKPKPWFVWCVAYTLFFVSIILSWEKWWDIMYPVNYLFLHLTVALIAKFRTANA